MRLSIAAIAAIVFVPFSSALAGPVGAEVISYTAGTGIAAAYQFPGRALGQLTPDTGFGYYLTPFNAAYSGDDLVGVGPGGSLTIRLSSPVPTTGFTLGVHAGVGVIDAAYPAGTAAAVASTYTSSRQATVAVSPDGSTWFDLGSRTFDLPSNVYAAGVTTPGEQLTPGTTAADLFKASPLALSDYNGKNWAEIQTLLDGSAGGSWLDLSSVAAGQIQYVRFDVPAGQRLFVDAVVGVPEPTTLSLAALGAMALLARRRSNGGAQ